MVTSTQLHNDSVRDLFREVINPLKSEFPDMAIIGTHHVTKASGADVTAKNVLGGAQWYEPLGYRSKRLGLGDLEDCPRPAPRQAAGRLI